MAKKNYLRPPSVPGFPFRSIQRPVMNLEERYMRNINELGLDRGSADLTVLDKATSEAIAEFESVAGVQLPEDYRQFLLESNGGNLKLRWYRSAQGRVGLVEQLFHLGKRDWQSNIDAGEWDYGNLWAETDVRRTVSGHGSVPIGRNGGDDIFFLDYAVVPPRVSVLSGSTREVLPITRNFAEFIDSLFEREPRVETTRRRRTRFAGTDSIETE